VLYRDRRDSLSIATISDRGNVWAGDFQATQSPAGRFREAFLVPGGALIHDGPQIVHRDSGQLSYLGSGTGYRMRTTGVWMVSTFTGPNDSSNTPHRYNVAGHALDTFASGWPLALDGSGDVLIGGASCSSCVERVGDGGTSLVHNGALPLAAAIDGPSAAVLTDEGNNTTRLWFAGSMGKVDLGLTGRKFQVANGRVAFSSTTGLTGTSPSSARPTAPFDRPALLEAPSRSSCSRPTEKSCRRPEASVSCSRHRANPSSWGPPWGACDGTTAGTSGRQHGSARRP
jgi:hypothetical protein